MVAVTKPHGNERPVCRHRLQFQMAALSLVLQHSNGNENHEDTKGAGDCYVPDRVVELLLHGDHCSAASEEEAGDGNQTNSGEQQRLGVVVNWRLQHEEKVGEGLDFEAEGIRR